MTPHRKTICALSIACVVSFFFIGCGVSQKKLDDAESRIKALEAQGIPDSLLSSPKLYLFQAKGAKKSSSTAYAKRYADSLFFFLEIAESEMQSTMEKYKPQVEALRKSIDERKSQLSGLQLQYTDSIIAIIDSFDNRGWLIQAKAKAVFLDTLFPRIIADEKRMKKVRPRLIGSWTSQRVPPGGYKALEKRRFTFTKDGKFSGSEEMKGQTSAYVKENWKFLTWGRWKLRGDTIMMFVDREKCLRQIYHNYMKKDGKLRWVKNQAPTYDTTLTDHSKDRYMTYGYVLDFFKRK